MWQSVYEKTSAKILQRRFFSEDVVERYLSLLDGDEWTTQSGAYKVDAEDKSICSNLTITYSLKDYLSLIEIISL